MSSLRASTPIIIVRSCRWRRTPDTIAPGCCSFDGSESAKPTGPCRDVTRALPALARPFCRRRDPLLSGEPVSPAWRVTVRRSCKSRENTSGTSMSAVSMPRPLMRCSSRSLAFDPFCGSSSSCFCRASSICLICWLMKLGAPFRAAARPVCWAGWGYPPACAASRDAPGHCAVSD